MPPGETPVPQPSPSDTGAMQPVVVKQDDPQHIPQWAVRGLLALLALVFIPGTIAVVSYVIGGIHARISDNERAVQELREDRAAMKARLTLIEGANGRQWQLIADNKEKIADHNH